MDLNIYVANLGKYNEGILQGEWFTLPVDLQEIKETIGLNEQYEEYAIHDYELPFPISEYESITKLNNIAELLYEHNEEEQKTIVALMHHMYYDIEDAIKALKDGQVILWEGNNMAEVAESMCESYGTLQEIPDNLVYYFDFEKYGRDLSITGTFIEIEYGLWMEILN